MNMVRHSSTLDRALELSQQGFSVIPLGSGPEGKGPSVMRWKGVSCPPSVIVQRMNATKSPMYGIALIGMVVIDVDSNDRTLIANLEDRFGSASVVIETPRGFHLYYAHEGREFPNLKAEQLPVDVKAGAGQYVVGPGSVRPCGGGYKEIRGRFGKTPLKPIRLPQQGTTNTAASARRILTESNNSKVKSGARHLFLLKRAVVFVRACENREELFENLIYVRDEEVEHPETITEGEILDIAKWAWEVYTQGNLFAFNGGSFRVPRHFLEKLGGSTAAIALYTVLCDKHGHQLRKTFGLSHKAMEQAGLIDLSQRAFQRAKAVLIKVGAIEVAVTHIAGKRSRQYRLGRVSSA